MRLSRLEIEDFALIARAALDFSDGFTVCSGETGSGKTMLLGALAFVLGERSSGDVVRTGTARTRVTLAADFASGADGPDESLRRFLVDAGLDGEPGDAVIFSREMAASGKSTARINGRLATTAQLREAAAHVVEQVGQHEQQRLLSRDYQAALLDRFAGGGALLACTRVASAFDGARQAERALDDASGDAGRAAAAVEVARFALREIDEVAPAPGEDESLRARRDYLANLERIVAALSAAHDALLGGENSSIDAVGTAATSVASIVRFAPTFEALTTTLAGLQSELGDVAATLARELENAEFDAAALDAAAARLDRIERLKKKYGGSIAEVLATRERSGETVARETTRDEREAQLRHELAEAHAQLAAAAAELTALRADAARALESRVAEELAGVAMPAARFAVVLEPLAEVGSRGAERIEFELSPNSGEPMRSLARAASGGELSRVLLALVVVVAEARERIALVFDEIDAGIGGATAAAVGIRLGSLARASQVLCVTHLAQIASWADRHYALRKRESNGATVVELVALEERRDVVEEIARMLSGTTAAVALEHAEALVRDVRGRKARTTLSA